MDQVMQGRSLDLTPYLALIAQELPRGCVTYIKNEYSGRYERGYDPKARRPLADLCRYLLKAKGVQSIRIHCPDPDLQATVSIFPAEGWPVYSFPVQDFMNAEALILREKSKPAQA
jgi:hypothetical protein